MLKKFYVISKLLLLNFCILREFFLIAAHIKNIFVMVCLFHLLGSTIKKWGAVAAPAVLELVL